MKKVLITGGSGFLGLNVIENLLKNRPDIEIYNCGRTAVDLKKVKNIQCNAVNFDFNSINCFEFDYIINLLALSNNKFCEDFDYASKINIDFTKRLLDFSIVQKKIRKIVHLSSIIIYDNFNIPPVKEDDKLYLNYNNYSFTKGISEFYANYFIKKYSLPLIIFRLSNIYGPYQKFINSPFLVPSKIMQALNEKKNRSV
ncbi:MAG: NAD(P)-dependent oxidoreductase [Candidatus Falkowbacteria bacterium]